MSDAPVSGPFLALVVWPSWRGARAARSVVRAWKTVRRWVESVVGVISIRTDGKSRWPHPPAAAASSSGSGAEWPLREAAGAAEVR